MKLPDRLVKIIIDRKSLKIKVLAVLIYQAGISYRKVRNLLECIEPFSHEALRKWYFRLKVYHRVIMVDETKVKPEDQWIYIWNAVKMSL